MKKFFILVGVLCLLVLVGGTAYHFVQVARTPQRQGVVINRDGTLSAPTASGHDQMRYPNDRQDGGGTLGSVERLSTSTTDPYPTASGSQPSTFFNPAPWVGVWWFTSPTGEVRTLKIQQDGDSFSVICEGQSYKAKRTGAQFKIEGVEGKTLTLMCWPDKNQVECKATQNGEEVEEWRGWATRMP